MVARIIYGVPHRALRFIAHRLPGGLAGAVAALDNELVTLRVHRAGVRAARRFRESLGRRLHLGCGDTRKPGFINIDTWTGDLTLDLRERLPFRDASCETIYSEHFLEHVDYPDATFRLLGECFRVLQPGGVFDVGVPDTEWPLLEYAGVSRHKYFEKAKVMWHPSWCQTRLEHVNFHFRQGTQHRMAYDYETLERTLHAAGFINVRRREFNPDTDAAHRQLGTLYVVTERPR
jgi:predicted SAM-dependent methyltransferase